MSRNYFPGSMLLALSLTGSCVFAATETAADDPQKPKQDSVWVKLATADVPFRSERDVLSPAIFDRSAWNVVEFPQDGTAVDLKLPHEGKGKDGKPAPALMGAVPGAGFVWLDLNGDGKRGHDEITPFAADKPARTFTWGASYEDGTSGTIVFKLVDIGEPYKAAIVRMGMKQTKLGATTIFLIDDNGNGRYDDLFRDIVMIPGEPLVYLSRQIYLGNVLHEILVHPAGQTVEVRPLPTLPKGTVHIFNAYKPSHKAENLRIHTLIITGKEGAFAFDSKRPSLEVPVGAYDLVYGLFQRGSDLESSEWVVLKKGERTSFNVEAAAITTPAWGEPVEAKFTIEQDGKHITVGPPKFVGKAGEVYQPFSYKKNNVSAFLTQIWYDKRMNNLARYEPRASHKFDIQPNNELKPVIFEWMKHDEMQVSIEYKSGILGVVLTKEKFLFIAKKK